VSSYLVFLEIGNQACRVRYRAPACFTSESNPGQWRVCASDQSYRVADGTVVRTYQQLTEIEQTFRVMKSDLGLRPIYHSKDERIERHLFITVLAYHTAHLVRTKLKQNGIHDSWVTIRDQLNKICWITTRMVKNKDRYLITEVDLSPSGVKLFACLGFVYDPDATRTVTEHVEQTSPPESQKPPGA